MKKNSIYTSLFLLAFTGAVCAQEELKGEIALDDVEVSATDDSVYVQMNIDFSELHVSANRIISLFPSVSVVWELVPVCSLCWLPS